MAENPRKKMFTAEIQRLKARGGVDALGATSAGVQEILDAISNLHGEFSALKETLELQASASLSSSGPPSAEIPESESPNASDHQIMVSAELAQETLALRDCIDQTKQELAALHIPVSSYDRFGSVTEELDAIVNATEAATETILSSAERIDEISASIENRCRDEDIISGIADIKEAVVQIFEASNFQDITGQRINKVVKALKYVEVRVNRMVEIWGEEALAGAVLEEEIIDEDSKLLNGPALGDGGISQAEIDALFG